MSGARVVVDYDFSPMDRLLSGLEEFGVRPEPMLDEMGGEMVSSTQRRFETSTGPDGKPWTPSKRALKQGGKTLVDQGHLRGSITHNVGADEVEWGSNLVYAAIHQFGGHAGRGAVVPIPQREYLGVDDVDIEILEGIGYDFLADAAGVAA